MRDINHPKSVLKRAVNYLFGVLPQRSLTFSELIRATGNPVGFIHGLIEELDDKHADEMEQALRWIFCPAQEIDARWSKEEAVLEPGRERTARWREIAK